MGDLPRLIVAPPMRCAFRLQDPSRRFCGEVARWFRPSVELCGDAYFCDEHRGSAVLSIPPGRVFRSVAIQLEVRFAGVTRAPSEAQLEALTRLERAIERAGGVINLHTVSSVLGRYSEPTGARPGDRAPARAE